tara:strand:+ start:585 stop:1025 length:441 start_codon:yes stop_codon:yes gene_type:complete
MNIEKITYKIVKDSIKEDNSCTDFVLRMILSYLSDEQRGTVMDEIVNEREHILFKKGDIITIDPTGNRYDLKDLYENDRMKDADLMNKDGYIKATIIEDCSYRDTCSPFSSEYKVNIDYYNKTQKLMQKELRVKRSNIISLWKGLE